MAPSTNEPGWIRQEIHITGDAVNVTPEEEEWHGIYPDEIRTNSAVYKVVFKKPTSMLYKDANENRWENFNS